MKPYWVQAASDRGHHREWSSDSHHDTLDDAAIAAMRLRREWHRRVRVIDAMTGRTLLQLPAPKRVRMAEP